MSVLLPASTQEEEESPVSGASCDPQDPHNQRHAQPVPRQFAGLRATVYCPGRRGFCASSSGPFYPPHADEVIVEVRAVGINLVDSCLRRGLIASASLPLALGVEGAGG